MFRTNGNLRCTNTCLTNNKLFGFCEVSAVISKPDIIPKFSSAKVEVIEGFWTLIGLIESELGFYAFELFFVEDYINLINGCRRSCKTNGLNSW